MEKSELGKLEKIDLRNCWKDEQFDFTPWLCEASNLELLGNTIGIELDLVGREQRVGTFKADILAKDTESDRYVIVENQLEKTNHNHLGQLLLYAAGYEARAVVWIAREFCEEHRKALDWLNEMTSDEVAFFGLEIELWRIGDSQPAPKFNLVCEPNEWARAVRPAGSSSVVLTDTKLLQKEFWQGLVEYMNENGTFLSMRKPRPQHWYTIAVGRSHFQISLTLNSRLKRAGCELYIRPPESKPAFSALVQEKETIEQELDANLEWQELPEKGASRIIQYHNADFENRDNWPNMFAWFKERSEAFNRVFSKRITNLKLTF